MSHDNTQPDYNFHMPRFITYPLPVALVSAILAGSVYSLLRPSRPIAASIVVGVCLLVGLFYLGIFAILKRITSLKRRLYDRDKLISEIPWRGDERVLDVGVGNGILLLSAAKQLTTGKGVGTDIWSKGSGDNKPDIFLRNAQIEGVADKVSLENEDARKLSYANESFDVVITGLTMHHLKADVDKGVSEMVRVLKPGGWMAIYDEPSTVFYCTILMRQNGLQIKKKTTSMVFGKKTD